MLNIQGKGNFQVWLLYDVTVDTYGKNKPKNFFITERLVAPCKNHVEGVQGWHKLFHNYYYHHYHHHRHYFNAIRVIDKVGKVDRIGTCIPTYFPL